MVRKLISPQRRTQAIQSLPGFVRHRLIDLYIQRARRKYRSYLREGGMVGLKDKTPVQVWESGLNKHARNNPVFYATTDRRFDVDRLQHYFEKYKIKGKVLDFGCNAGRALHYFTDAGYRAIGVEMDAEAVALGKATYKSLGEVEFFVGDGAKMLPLIPDRAAEIGYSIAVLRHIAPSDIENVIGQLCRVVSGYFISIEDEASISNMSFLHDYCELFGQHGWKQIDCEYAVNWPGFEGSSATMMRVFAPI